MLQRLPCADFTSIPRAPIVRKWHDLGIDLAQFVAKRSNLPQHKNEMTDIPVDEQIALTMFDKNEPRSLINIVWDNFRPHMETAREFCKPYLGESERKLRRRCKATPIDEMVRMRYWQEYERAQLKNDKMIQREVIKHVCAEDYWIDNICKDPKKLAFILTPLSGYMIRMESSLYVMLDEIDKILRLPIQETKFTKEGVPYKVTDTKLIGEKIKLFQMLDTRVKGAVIQKLAIHQRVDNRTQISQVDPISNMNLTDLEAIDARLKQVQIQIKRAQNRELMLPASNENVIDVGTETLGEGEHMAVEESFEAPRG